MWLPRWSFPVGWIPEKTRCFVRPAVTGAPGGLGGFTVSCICSHATGKGRAMRWMASGLESRFGLGVKIFLASTLLVVTVLGSSLGITALSATRTADAAIERALTGTRRAIADLLAARTRTLAAMGAVSARVPQFREGLSASRERADILHQAQEDRDLSGAAWVLVTNEAGILLARTDYPDQFDRDLSSGALVAGALSGAQGSGAWLDDMTGRLDQAVAAPLTSSREAAPQGVLVTASALDDSAAQAIKQATTSDIVLFALDTLGRAHVVGSTLPREEVAPSLPDSAQLAALAQDTVMVRLDAQVGDEHPPGLAGPIRSAGWHRYRGVVAFRSRDAELAAFRALRGTMAAALLLGVALALGLALVLARHAGD